jgi:hypothetical protein
MTRLRFAAILLLATTLGAECSTEPSDELLAAKARWEREGYASYTYDYAQQCFCPVEFIGPVTIRVVNGSVTEVTDKQTGNTVPLEQFGRRWPTVPELFELVERAGREADDFDVTFHPVTGHPTDFFADWIENAVDDELGFDATNLQPLR